jgi:pimeloyl-ACP methyl ester carboxylesterase
VSPTILILFNEGLGDRSRSMLGNPLSGLDQLPAAEGAEKGVPNSVTSSRDDSQTLGYGLADSPAGLPAWIYDKFAACAHSGGEPERVLTRDEMLDDITLYWVTNSATSSSQLYWENKDNVFNALDISIPVAVTVFPGEIYRAPRRWAERNYHKLIYWNEVDKDGHLAAFEQPELFTAEIRAAFRSLRKLKQPITPIAQKAF